jgi:hypothetical protein
MRLHTVSTALTLGMLLTGCPETETTIGVDAGDDSGVPTERADGGNSDTDNDAGEQPEVAPEVLAAAQAAFEFGYPLNEIMRVSERPPVMNRAFSMSTLATPADKTVVLPNNDTLYTQASLYLGESWVKLSLPAPNGRYMSAAIFDAYSNEAALVSARDIPEAGGEYYLVQRGASRAGIPDNAQVFEVSTPYALLLVRTLVNGPEDLEAARAAQQGIAVTGNSAAQPDPVGDVSASSDAQAFYLKLMQRLAQNPPQASERDLVSTFARAGIVPSLTPDLSQVDAEQQAAWEIAFANSQAALAAASSTLYQTRGSWEFPDPNVAQPGTNYALRAAVARFMLLALPPTESLYPRSQGDGSTPHVLHLPSSWPPIESSGFWSLTMYADGYLVDNPIDRYSIGDRTPGLTKESDGSLKIYIQCEDPGGELSANWLPAPCGPYAVTMRLYVPTAEAQAPSFTLPNIE